MRYLIFMLFFPLWLTAQQSNYFTLSGRVLHAQTGAPLSHAHVGIPERGIGTTTGYDGRFVFKVPRYYEGSDLVISYLGFQTYRVPIEGIQQALMVRLKPTASSLQEVVVMDESRVEDLIRKAVRRIPQNYPNYPTSLTAFYRESKTNADENYVYLAEGVLNLYKRSYANDKEGQVGLIQGRKVTLVPEEELQANTRFSSGHLAADRFDFVKNREDFLDEDYFPAYKYWISSITSYNEQPVYVISFDREDSNKDARMKGQLYLDTLSYAIVRAEFEILPDAQRRYNDYPLYTGRWKGNRYYVNYRKVEGRWHLSEALREGIWRDSSLYTNELIITEVKPGRGKVVPYIERLGRDDRFLDRTGTYDEDFWTSYNTAPLNDERLAETVQQLNNQGKATEVFDTTFLNALRRQQDSIAQVKSQTEQSADSSFITYAPGNPPDFSAPPKWDLRFSYGVGAHGLATQAAQYRIAYFTPQQEAPVLELDAPIDARNLEIIYQWALDVTYQDRYLLRWTLSRDFGNSIYRESAIGGGLQANLTPRRRPLYMRPLVQFSRLHYAREIGEADNDFGDFEADGKTIKANKVSMYRGERLLSWKLSLEFALELNPSRELFLRAGYQMPFNQSNRVFLRERGRLFPKRAMLETDVLVLRDGEQDSRSLTGMAPTLSLTIGILMK